jgi:hypothetical protein
MPFQHLPERNEKEHKNMSKMQVSEERYKLGGPPATPFRNYEAEMLLTAELYLDGAARIVLTTYLKQTGFHNMDKT